MSSAETRILKDIAPHLASLQHVYTQANELMAVRYERLSALRERAEKLERRTDSLSDTTSEKSQRLLEQQTSVQNAADELEFDLDDLERWLPEVQELTDYLETQVTALDPATQLALIGFSQNQSKSAFPMN